MYRYVCPCGKSESNRKPAEYHTQGMKIHMQVHCFVLPVKAKLNSSATNPRIHIQKTENMAFAKLGRKVCSWAGFANLKQPAAPEPKPDTMAWDAFSGLLESKWQGGYHR